LSLFPAFSLAISFARSLKLRASEQARDIACSLAQISSERAKETAREKEGKKTNETECSLFFSLCLSLARSVTRQSLPHHVSPSPPLDFLHARACVRVLSLSRSRAFSLPLSLERAGHSERVSNVTRITLLFVSRFLPLIAHWLYLWHCLSLSVYVARFKTEC